MKLWQQHAQQLPIRTRPLRLETVTSYATRLADANELPRPTILLRALGQPYGNLAATTMHDYDIALNAAALTRLETFTDIPAHRLRKSLPAISYPVDLPNDIPRTKLIRCWGLRRPCDRCAARAPGTPMIHPQGHPAICVRHNLWLDTDRLRRSDAGQLDLAPAPEMLTAHRRYQRLRTRITNDTDTNQWCQQQLLTATLIVSSWMQLSRVDCPRLLQTWTARSTALWPSLNGPAPSTVLVFPEAVALAEILTDPHWRQHVATTQFDTDLKPFFHRIATRLGQPQAFALRVRFSSVQSPLRRWINDVRHHGATHNHRWHQPWQPGLQNEDLSKIRHFR